jgi:hypothetical protein
MLQILRELGHSGVLTGNHRTHVRYGVGVDFWALARLMAARGA